MTLVSQTDPCLLVLVGFENGSSRSMDTCYGHRNLPEVGSRPQVTLRDLVLWWWEIRVKGDITLARFIVPCMVRKS